MPFQQLLALLKSTKQIEDELKEIQEKSKMRASDIMRKYKGLFQVQIDKVKVKNGVYTIDNQKSSLSEENKCKFIEGSWDLQRNSNVAIINQKKIYHQYLTKLEEAFTAVYKQFDQFVSNKKTIVKQLKEKKVRLEAQYGQKKSYLDLLSSNQAAEAQIVGLKENLKIYDIGLVPYLNQKVDKMFQKQLGEMNLGKPQFTSMKEKRNNIIGKVQYLIQLLKRKQKEKKYIDGQNDVEIQYYNQENILLEKQIEECLLKEKEINQYLQRTKEEHYKQTSFMMQELKKHKHYPPQLGQFKRIYSRISSMLQRYRKKEKKRKTEYAKNNTVDKKVDKLIEKAKVDEDQKLEQQLKGGVRMPTMLVEHKQIKNEQPPKQEEIIQSSNDDKVSEISSGKISSDTVSSVSAKRKASQVDKLSSKSSNRQQNEPKRNQQ